MTLNTNTTVREIALERPEATRIFEKLGIDYCCGGAKSLAESCAAAGVETDELLRLLEGAALSSEHDNAATFRSGSLAELTGYIVDKHHAFTRDELARLDALLAKVCSVHGRNHAELLRVRELFEELRDDLLPHMLKEERVLFPYIGQMEDAVARQQPLQAPFFGTVRNPVRMMSLEHDRAGELLRAMREASGGYGVPSDACVSYQTLYQALEAFELDLHQHVHLENNILFPRAVEMEASLSS